MAQFTNQFVLLQVKNADVSLILSWMQSQAEATVFLLFDSYKPPWIHQDSKYSGYLNMYLAYVCKTGVCAHVSLPFIEHLLYFLCLWWLVTRNPIDSGRSVPCRNFSDHWLRLLTKRCISAVSVYFNSFILLCCVALHCNLLHCVVVCAIDAAPKIHLIAIGTGTNRRKLWARFLPNHIDHEHNSLMSYVVSHKVFCYHFLTAGQTIHYSKPAFIVWSCRIWKAEKDR